MLELSISKCYFKPEEAAETFISALRRSDGFVWVEHDSDDGVSGAAGDVLVEFDSNHAGVSVSGHDGAPSHSVSSVVRSGFDLVDIGNSLTKVELGGIDIAAVLDGNKSLVLLLMVLGSSETCEDTFLIKSHWLSFVVDRFSFALGIGGFSFLTHSFSFVIMIIQ